MFAATPRFARGQSSISFDMLKSLCRVWVFLLSKTANPKTLKPKTLNPKLKPYSWKLKVKITGYSQCFHSSCGDKYIILFGCVVWVGANQEVCGENVKRLKRLWQETDAVDDLRLLKEGASCVLAADNIVEGWGAGDWRKMIARFDYVTLSRNTTQLLTEHVYPPNFRYTFWNCWVGWGLFPKYCQIMSDNVVSFCLCFCSTMM